MREHVQNDRQGDGGVAIEVGEARGKLPRSVFVGGFRQAPQSRPDTLRRAPLQQHAIMLVAQHDEERVLFRQRARGARCRNHGRDSGPVRPPLTNLTEAEMAELSALVAKLPSTTSAMQAAE